MSALKKLANEVWHGLRAAAIVFCLGIVALGVDFVCWDEPAAPERPASWYEPSRQELEAAHRYHGITLVPRMKLPASGTLSVTASASGYLRIRGNEQRGQNESTRPGMGW